MYELPSRLEKNTAIEKILEALPPKQNFLSFLLSRHRALGIKNIMHGSMDVAFLFILIGMINIFFIINIPIQFVFTLVFFISPIIYMTIYAVAYLKEKEQGVIDVMDSCKYRFRHIILFRMLYFSGANLLLNGIICVLISGIYSEVSFFRIFLISMVSMFMYSIGQIYVCFYKEIQGMFYIYSLIWLFISAMFFVFSQANTFLLSIPIIFLALLVFCLMYIIKCQIKYVLC